MNKKGVVTGGHPLNSYGIHEIRPIHFRNRGWRKESISISTCQEPMKIAHGFVSLIVFHSVISRIYIATVKPTSHPFIPPLFTASYAPYYHWKYSKEGGHNSRVDCSNNTVQPKPAMLSLRLDYNTIAANEIKPFRPPGQPSRKPD
jgi:hypothetical protein